MRTSHSHFFSSLKQLEKRLRLDDNPSKTPTQSFISSPLLYLDEIDSVTGNASETPLQFLSESPLGQQTQVEEEERVVGNEVELLMQVLGLSDDDDDAVEVDFGCDHSFYGNIIGVKGPKCKKEVERLEGWISRERRRRSEPLRLGHLLLGKAALLHSNVEFPSTVDDFLHNDPPIE